jgi:hypothetical protein
MPAMSRDRFRRLRPKNGDLFAHFGVAVDPAPAPERAPVVEARGCSQCGWYVSVDAAACPLCGRATAVEAGRP